MSHTCGTQRSRRGSVLVVAIVITAMLGTLTLLFMTVSTRSHGESTESQGQLASFYAAEAALSEGWVELQNGGDGNVGTADDPRTFGGLTYWVEANEVSDDVTTLVASGTDGHRTSRMELVVEDKSSEINDFGIFGERLVTLRSNCFIDSYDSGVGTYASQVSAGHALSNGNVGSNDSVSVSANARVYGYAQYGPDVGDTISIASNVMISDGYGAAQTHISMPAISVPTYANQGAYTVNTNQTKTLGPGNLEYTSITTKSNSSLTIKGPCNLVLTSDCVINSNSSWNFDATNGPINVYAKSNFQLKSNSTVSTTVKDPTKLTFYLSGEHAAQNSSSPTISFASNSQFYGTVYAPKLSVVISSNFELYGSLKSRWLELSSNARVHYDQRLATGALDAGQGYKILAWRPLDGALAPLE